MSFRRIHETTIFGNQIRFISGNQHMDVVHLIRGLMEQKKNNDLYIFLIVWKKFMRESLDKLCGGFGSRKETEYLY